MNTLRYFNQLYDPAKEHMAAMAAEWDEYEKAYHGEPEREKPAGKGAWRSFVHFKYAWQQTHTLVAEVAGDPDPTFMWEPRNATLAQHADTIQGVVMLQFERDDYAEKRYMSALTAAVYGGCPVKASWLYAEDEDGVVLEDRPTATILSPDQFFYDPRARHMREARYAGHLMRMDLDELKAPTRADGTPFYKNLEQLEGAGGSDSRLDNGQLDNDNAGERDKARRDGIEVVEMWTRSRVMVRANGVIIRDDPSPIPGHLPFEVIRLIPSLNDVWGVSLMTALRDPQSLIHSLDNAAMDNIKLALDPPRAVDISDDADNADREWMPGQVYPSRNPQDAVRTLQGVAIDPNSAQAAIASIRDIAKQITGIVDEIAGQSRADTATEAAINQRQAKGRLGVMMNLVDAGWAKVAQKFLLLDQKYLDLSVPIKVMGPGRADWRHVGPKELSGVWDARPKNSTERIVKELHRESLIQAIATLSQFADRALPSGKTIDITRYAEELADSFGIAKEAVVVSADKSREQRHMDLLADAMAQAEAMKLMPAEPPMPPMPPPAPEPTPGIQDQIRTQFKDLGPEQQKDYLAQIGLTTDGIDDKHLLDRQEQEARIAKLGEAPNAGKLGQKARKENTGA
jgi:hypothetical protein